MNSSIILRKFKLPKNTSPGLDCFTGEFDPKFEEELVPLVHNLFQKIEEERTFFSEVSITLVQNQRWRMKKKDRKKRKEGKKGEREGEKETIGQYSSWI